MGALCRHAHGRRSETARGQGARPKVNSYTISVSKVALLNRTRTPSNGWVKTTVTTRVEVIPPFVEIGKVFTTLCDQKYCRSGERRDRDLGARS